MFCIKGVPKNIDKNQEKNLILESLFNQVAGLHHATLLKKRLHYRCFPVQFGKFYRTAPDDCY